MENAGVFGGGTVEHTRCRGKPWKQLGSLGGGGDGSQDWSWKTGLDRGADCGGENQKWKTKQTDVSNHDKKENSFLAEGFKFRLRIGYAGLPPIELTITQH